MLAFTDPPIQPQQSSRSRYFEARRTLKFDEQSGTFKYSRIMWKTCNVDKISGQKRSAKITDRFACLYSQCKNLYIGATELGEGIHAHFRDAEIDYDKRCIKTRLAP